MVSTIAFIVLFAAAVGFFTYNVRKIGRNIKLGRDVDRNDNSALRWKTMARVALGQSKMTVRPIAGLLHIIVYVGFILINIEVVEIIVDGIFGTHRFLSFMGGFYDVMIAFFEVLAVMVLLACVLFLVRRNILKLKRFWSKEMTTWPRSDANIILFVEILLMLAFLGMNTADLELQNRGVDHYSSSGCFPISTYLLPLVENLSDHTLIMVERFTWWFHIFGILAFLNYLPYSKHFHIILAFPNVYYSNLNPKGQFNNMESVTKEVKLMFDPSADPYANPPEGEPTGAVERFGAKDVQDLTWKQLMDAYSCTECGRCTSNCPANITGKALSPRKIMMDTRDRLVEVGKNIDKQGKEFNDGKSLLGDYISEEELWACTSCNACTESCPVNIDPLSIIVDMRRSLVMEESKIPAELGVMSTNIENNGAPWQFAQADRLKWTEEEN